MINAAMIEFRSEIYSMYSFLQKTYDLYKLFL